MENKDGAIHSNSNNFYSHFGAACGVPCGISNFLFVGAGDPRELIINIAPYQEMEEYVLPAIS